MIYQIFPSEQWQSAKNSISESQKTLEALSGNCPEGFDSLVKNFSQVNQTANLTFQEVA